jgi:hypothetical protein
MTLSSNSLRLQRSAVTLKDCIIDTAPEGCHTFVIGFGHPLNANAVSMDDLVCYIENWTDHPPVNRTNLRGLSLCTPKVGFLCDCPLHRQTVMGE